MRVPNARTPARLRVHATRPSEGIPHGVRPERTREGTEPHQALIERRDIRLQLDAEIGDPARQRCLLFRDEPQVRPDLMYALCVFASLWPSRGSD